MAAQRYYYSDTIADFLFRGTNEVVGTLTLASHTLSRLCLYSRHTIAILQPYSRGCLEYGKKQLRSRQKGGSRLARRSGNELTTRCSQLKLIAADGKRYATDYFAQEDIIQLVRVIPSKKTDHFLDGCCLYRQHH